ncbi:MAG TPA: YihY/virulence factor BrkB family protein [Allosphingosinicella sp.]|nr:YihY/virulence factor BrkB family protein [Allosphingosinicella sp.]
MQPVSPESPEARRKRLARARARFGNAIDKVRPGSKPFKVLRRVAIGVYSDGFIHAGNLAYLTLMTIFPFVIVAAALAHLLGQTEGGMRALSALLQTMPRSVSEVLRKPVTDVLHARSGGLLWLGGIVGLWTTASFIETIRDILRRAYGVRATAPFWEYRLLSVGLIIASVMLMLIAFSVSILLSGVEQFVRRIFPAASDIIALLAVLHVVPALILFGSIYFVFVTLTPRKYRRLQCRKWPGAAFVALWWITTTALLPVVLSQFGNYNLTYGSLASVIIALIFFFVIGLGVVIGAELNAALADTPEPTPEEVEKARAEGELL